MTISALVSAYYAERFLHQRLTNLKEQSAEVEAVVVCQKGSKEAEIAKNFDVRVIVTPDIPTIGVAWNIAIRAASGDYCVVANTDDYFLPDGLKILADVLDEHPEAGYVFSNVLLAERGKLTPRPNHGRLDKPGLIPNAHAILKRRYFCGPMPMWRRSLHERYGYFDEEYIVASDYDWVYRLASAGVGIYWLDKNAGVYRVRYDSLEHRNKVLIPVENGRVRA